MDKLFKKVYSVLITWLKYCILILHITMDLTGISEIEANKIDNYAFKTISSDINEINFRKIPAKNFDFLKIKSKFKDDINYFEKYADSLTQKSREIKDNKSGKGRSYANYLVRLIMFYQEFYKERINNILTFHTLKRIENIVTSNGFKEYNENENRFPNATFNCYISCVTHLNSYKEEARDLRLNENLETFNVNIDNTENSNVKKVKKRKEKQLYDKEMIYPRDRKESLMAKRKSGWICEIDSNHKTFISKANKNFYIEAHHLIPMSAQDYFNNTLDFADNIVCLCANCHREIHHGLDNNRKELVTYLFKKKKEKYPTYGISINLKMLLNFYEII